MKIFTTLMKNEWLQLKRSGLMKWLFLMVTLCAVYAIYYGNSSIKRQLTNISSLQQANESTKNRFYRYFENQKTADTTRFGWAGMNTIYDGITTEEFLENNMAVNMPNRFSSMSLGQRDVYPLYRKVTARSLYYDGAGISLDDKYVETSNPHKLLTGNFDLSFVILYLFPLFIIAFCYNIVSQEKEIGSYPFLRNLPISFPKIVAIRFLFRFGVVLGLAWFFGFLAFVLSPVAEPYAISSLWLWQLIVALYLLFWSALAWMIVSMHQNSSVSALVLLGCWVVFLIIVPSAVNNYIAANYKISSRTAFVNELRQQVDAIWDLPDSITVKDYYADYPEYSVTPMVPLWTAGDSFDSLGLDETLDKRYNKKFMVWHYYLDKMIARKLGDYDRQLIDKQSAANKFMFINPVVATQDFLNRLSRSGHGHQQRFKRAVAEYRDLIFAMTNAYVFEDRKLALEDYKRYPEFDLEKYETETIEFASVTFVLVGFIFVFLLAGYWMPTKTNN